MDSLRYLIRRDFAMNRRWLDRLTLLAYRVARHAHLHPRPSARHRLILAVYPFVKNALAMIVGGGGLAPSLDLGPGVRFPHHMSGVFIGANVRIGADAVIFHQVTIGAARYEGLDGPGTGGPEPVIGDRVVIYPGAKVIGGVRVGHDVTIGANTVATHDVPDGATVAGSPARIVGEGHR